MPGQNLQAFLSNLTSRGVLQGGGVGHYVLGEGVGVGKVVGESLDDLESYRVVIQIGSHCILVL